MQLLSKTNGRVFYGWIVVTTSFVIFALILGSRYCFGVFFKSIENEFVEQLRKLLTGFFPDTMPVGFDLKYFIGEDDKGIRGLYFEINSKNVGNIFFKFKPMKAWETPADHEERFISEIVNDLMLAGITFVNFEKLKENEFNKNKGWLKASRKIHVN